MLIIWCLSCLWGSDSEILSSVKGTQCKGPGGALPTAFRIAQKQQVLEEAPEEAGGREMRWGALNDIISNLLKSEQFYSHLLYILKMRGQLASWQNSQAPLVALVTYLAKQFGQRLSIQYAQLGWGSE